MGKAIQCPYCSGRFKLASPAGAKKASPRPVSPPARPAGNHTPRPVQPPGLPAREPDPGSAAEDLAAIGDLIQSKPKTSVPSRRRTKNPRSHSLMPYIAATVLLGGVIAGMLFYLPHLRKQPSPAKKAPKSSPPAANLAEPDSPVGNPQAVPTVWDRFDGVSWAKGPEALGEYRTVEEQVGIFSSGRLEWYQPASSRPLLGESQMDRLVYGFRAGHLIEARGRCRNRSALEQLSQWLEETYGAGSPTGSGDVVQWEGKTRDGMRVRIHFSPGGRDLGRWHVKAELLPGS
jgi:hypothetical protein